MTYGAGEERPPYLFDINLPEIHDAAFVVAGQVQKGTTVTEIRYNYCIPNNRCFPHTEDERYCVLVKWDAFVKSLETWIDIAFANRDQDIAKKVNVYPQ